ncbi:mitochondrial 39s ribosomal protein l49 [Holotrichia oblita]|uniref:Mitochondrial 39s ribosomal protein l49 n=1 Tax=Holotrichia oblita TaxID=644536 RepID=A0ACB9TF14_HOLOL|nr:mitochondrial 39s ribosomal protein l49 [Holotrichia oblita]
MSTVLAKRLATLHLHKHLYLINTAKRYPSNAVEQNSTIKYEVSKNSNEWKYVERILPPKVIPEPKYLTEYPSGWKPQEKSAEDLPFYTTRTKNHMIPVYLKTSHRGTKRLTYVKKIQGDIWQMEKELLQFLQEEQVRPIRSQVNELAKHICFHGDYVNAIKYYLMKNNL